MAKIDDRTDTVQVRAISGACFSLVSKHISIRRVDNLLNYFLADSFLNASR